VKTDPTMSRRTVCAARRRPVRGVSDQVVVGHQRKDREGTRSCYPNPTADQMIEKGALFALGQESAIGTNAKCRPGPEMSAVWGRPDISRIP
jgi:hypothetical protein